MVERFLIRETKPINMLRGKKTQYEMKTMMYSLKIKEDLK